jgi:hypothetical protein
MHILAPSYISIFQAFRIPADQHTAKACDEDAISPKEAIEGARPFFSDLRVEVIHAGHGCPYERPEEAARLIMGFVREESFV